MMKEKQFPPKFIDLFSGCGGLSLGLLQAGWQGIFAIEKAEDAFATFQENLLADDSRFRFEWPAWLEKRAYTIDEVLTQHESKLKGLGGSIDVVAGGPPCQGFSYSGRRKKLDPRNKLFKKYVQFVDDVKPRALILENVPGMRVPHGTKSRGNRRIPGPVPKSHYEKLVRELADIGYVAEGKILDPSDFGVPQRRPRLIVVGLEESIARNVSNGLKGVFDYIEACRIQQLRTLGLPDKVSASDAISDLVTRGKPLSICPDLGFPGVFYQPTYEGPVTAYQKLMHKGFGHGPMDSLRLANHSKAILERFKLILKNSRKGVTLSDLERQRFGVSKNRTFLMAPDQPAPTVTTLPDDVLHYSEPRILSVRETARLQSFPDWFKFLGKYTTGGDRRKRECPRYTQVGNAVPPLLARAVAAGLARALAEAVQHRDPNPHMGASSQIRDEATATA